MIEEKRLSTWEVLRYKFPAEEYVLLSEVSDASGHSRSRSLDYMIVNLWNSRGLAVTGIEEKSNRSDWLREIKQPAKQENHYKHCDYFYLLTDREGVAKLEEIPITWGWYHINEKQILKTMKPAPKLNPEPIGRSLLCAMLRRAASKEYFVHVNSIEDRIKEAVTNDRTYRNREYEKLQSEYNEMKRQVVEFEKASGVHVADKWRYHGDPPEKVGAAIKFYLDNEGNNFREHLIKMQSEAQLYIDKIKQILE